MGLWSGIKYAINSSLGKPEFKPLDIMIGEQAGEIKATNLIKYGSAVKSVQRGSTAMATATPTNVTISAVNMSKTTVVYLGFTAANIGSSSNTDMNNFRYIFPRLQLLNSTTLSIHTALFNTGIGVPTISWEVVEYY